MTLPATPVVPGGLLDTVLGHWATNRWNPGDLARFRMGPEEDFAALPDDQQTALGELSDDDRAALAGLTPEQLAELADDDGDDDDLSDKVKNVLAKERTAARAAKKAKRAAETAAAAEKARADRLQAEIDRLRKKPKPGEDDGDREAAIAAARQQAEDEANAKADDRVKRAEVKAAAAGKFSDPALAVRLIDLDQVTVDAAGEVDKDEIAELLDEILDNNPGLAVKAKTKPKPNPGQGKKGSPAAGADAGRAEAERRFGKREAATAGAK